MAKWSRKIFGVLLVCLNNVKVPLTRGFLHSGYSQMEGDLMKQVYKVKIN